MTTVDRRAVQELIECRLDNPIAANILSDLLKGLAELPSSNAQAVAFDDAAILRALHAWFEDPKATHDLPESFKKRMRCAIRALCVCSGET